MTSLLRKTTKKTKFRHRVGKWVGERSGGLGWDDRETHPTRLQRCPSPPESSPVGVEAVDEAVDEAEAEAEGEGEGEGEDEDAVEAVSAAAHATRISPTRKKKMRTTRNSKKAVRDRNPSPRITTVTQIARPAPPHCSVVVGGAEVAAEAEDGVGAEAVDGAEAEGGAGVANALATKNHLSHRHRLKKPRLSKNIPRSAAREEAAPNVPLRLELIPIPPS